MESHLFIMKDFLLLQEKIKVAKKYLTESGKEIGDACQQGAETYHDNAPFEEAIRQQNFWSGRVSELISLTFGVEIIEHYSGSETVTLGSTVEFEDLGDKSHHTITIGSYAFAAYSDQEGVTSYASPLGAALLGARVGDTRVFGLRKRNRMMKILKIS